MPAPRLPAAARHAPDWLRALLDKDEAPPRLFAWTVANLAPATGTATAAPPASLRPASSPADDLDRRIFVVGIGNLGRLYASSLAALAPPPPLTLVVHRKDLLEDWLRSGAAITMESRDGRLVSRSNFDLEWWTDRPPPHGPVREVAAGRKVRNLLICTKTHAAMAEADRLRRYLDGTSTLVFTQNGVSNFWPPYGPLYASRRYPPGGSPSFLASVTTHGLSSRGPFHSLHASPADVKLGPVLVNRGSQAPTGESNLTAGSLHLICQLCAAPGLACSSVSSGQLWLLQLEKLVINAIINPLTALLRCKNGDLFQPDDDVLLAPIIDQLLAEISRLLQALVQDESSTEMLAALLLQSPSSTPPPSTASPPDLKLDALRSELEVRFSVPKLRAMLHAVGAKLADNFSSMLQDVRAGKETEIRHINGWLLDTAHHLPHPPDLATHRALLRLVEKASPLTPQQLAQQLLNP